MLACEVIYVTSAREGQASLPSPFSLAYPHIRFSIYAQDPAQWVEKDTELFKGLVRVGEEGCELW